MLFWVIAAALTLGASLAVLLPLTGRAAPAGGDADHDLEVYRDQLAELERDVERGLIQPAEAEQARAEIGRRILRIGRGRNADDGGAAAAPGASRAAKLVATISVLAVPLVSWGMYSQIGSPDLPSQPLSERLAKDPAQSSVDELVARAEAHLAADPSDGRGWEVLAPIYMRMQRFSDSVMAYRNAIRLLGLTAQRQAGLGEAIANAAGGIISADAQAAFQEALKLDPADAKANFYLAMGLAQEKRIDDAKAAWERMLTSLPADSPWRDAVRQALAQAGGNVAASDQAAPAPSQQEVDAASSMSPKDRAAMIEAMVATLDQKLRQNPQDPEGWMRLVRSYVVLGRTDEARDALSRGIAAFGAGSDEAKKLAAFGATLGLSAVE
jgi:cytochrome c-type biogenesis protein CcmH